MCCKGAQFRINSFYFMEWNAGGKNAGNPPAAGAPIPLPCHPAGALLRERMRARRRGNLLLMHRKVLYINSLSISLPCRSPHSARRCDSDIDGASKMLVDRLSDKSALQSGNPRLSKGGQLVFLARWRSLVVPLSQRIGELWSADCVPQLHCPQHQLLQPA